MWAKCISIYAFVAIEKLSSKKTYIWSVRRSTNFTVALGTTARLNLPRNGKIIGVFTSRPRFGQCSSLVRCFLRAKTHSSASKRHVCAQLSGFEKRSSYQKTFNIPAVRFVLTKLTCMSTTPIVLFNTSITLEVCSGQCVRASWPESSSCKTTGHPVAPTQTSAIMLLALSVCQNRKYVRERNDMATLHPSSFEPTFPRS